ncbi:ParA family protein [Nonomuraea sp. NPDC050556]|uniref:ParA family protein n=1 Tax=Nonomuraea sp. NPDC050556 TaxID=3364369 RepID=UPI0037A02284
MSQLLQAAATPAGVFQVERPRVIAFVNRKGGVGKSTTTINVAATLGHNLTKHLTPEQRAEYQCEVVVVSVDPQGSSLGWAKRIQNKELLPFDYVDASLEAGLIQDLIEDGYRYILIDTPGWTPPDEDTWDGMDDSKQATVLRAVLDMADEIIVPMEPEALCYEPTMWTVERTMRAHPKPFRILINNCGASENDVDLRNLRRWLAKRPHWPVFRSTIRGYKLHSRAPEQGVVCTEYPENTIGLKARGDFADLTLEIAMEPASRSMAAVSS